jgi:hypothetical protein
MMSCEAVPDIPVPRFETGVKPSPMVEEEMAKLFDCSYITAAEARPGSMKIAAKMPSIKNCLTFFCMVEL